MPVPGLEAVSTCKRCAAPLDPSALECLQCHALTHADDLQRIATEAKLLESQGQLRAAREHWLSALPLLPADAQQAAWINKHAVDLYAQALEREAAQREQKSAADHGWAKRFGPLAPLVVLLIFKFKFLFSFFGFIAFYWGIYGKWFGIGFAALILCHEMGHFFEVKRRHLPVEMPVFLPGFGAYVKWQGMGVPVSGRAMIALAGPMAGLISSAACYALYLQTHSSLWLALANAAAWLNLLNLIPVWILDGAHAVEALNRNGRIALLTGCLVLAWMTSNLLFLFVAGGFAWQTFFVPSPEEGDLGILLYFGFLLCGLGVMLRLAPMGAF